MLNKNKNVDNFKTQINNLLNIVNSENSKVYLLGRNIQNKYILSSPL